MTRWVGPAVLSVACLGAPVNAIATSYIINAVSAIDTPLAFGVSPSSCPAGLTCAPGSISFDQDLTGHGFAPGDVVTGATLEVRLTELVSRAVNLETYRYTLGAQTFDCVNGNCVRNGGVIDRIGLSSAALADLAADGSIRITVSALSGSFVVSSAVLTADITPSSVFPPSPVPEPSAWGLIGAGLALVVGLRVVRRARNRH